MNKSHNSPNPNTTPSITEELKPCPFCSSDAIDVRGSDDDRWWAICDDCGGRQWAFTRDAAITVWNKRPDQMTMAIAAMQQPVHADVKRLLREARPYVEEAGLRHHDVSGLLAEINAALLVSNRSGVEMDAMQAVRGAALEMLRRCNVAEDVFASVAAATYSEIKAHTALDNEGEGEKRPDGFVGMHFDECDYFISRGRKACNKDCCS